MPKRVMQFCANKPDEKAKEPNSANMRKANKEVENGFIANKKMKKTRKEQQTFKFCAKV